MRGIIVKLMRKLHPTTVKSTEKFIGRLKQFNCASVTAVLSAVDKDNEQNFRCTIYFYANTTSWPLVVYCKELFWSKEIIARDNLSERLRLLAQTEFAKIRREVLDIRVAVVDLNRDRWTMTDDGRWSKA